MTDTTPTEYSPDAPKPYIGRCKDCDYSLFTAAEHIVHADNARAGGPAVNVGNGQIMGRCLSGHRWFVLRRIKGTYSEDHTCDSRCMNAKGHTCTCSCGGLNHGRGYAAAAPVIAGAETFVGKPVTADGEIVGHVVNVEFVALGTLTGKPVGKHLGEVGKHITGNVRVLSINPQDNGSKIFEFATNDSDIITWWRPSFVECDWKVGDTFKLRAKVKAHKVFRNVNQTVVTYAERVE